MPLCCCCLQLTRKYHPFRRFLNYYIEGLAWSVLHSPRIDGTYYDGINFSRRAMRRIRRALNAAAHDRDGVYRQPLMDSHTGAGDRPPPGLAYLSHFAYLDSFWFAEGLNPDGPPGYWLLEASGQIHGISGDLLSHAEPSLVGYRSMLFGMTVRNTAGASSLWKLWDMSAINATELIGWWEATEERPIHLSLSHNESATSRDDAGNCSIVHTGRSYPSSSGGSNGNIGFGGKTCGKAKPTSVPAMTAAEASAYCCGQLAGECVGFSFDEGHADAQGRAGGCFKKNAAGGRSGTGPPGFQGYTKRGLGPGGGNNTAGKCGTNAEQPNAVLASAFTAHGTHAIIAIASWCEREARIKLDVDWDSLVLHKGAVRLTQPAIDTLQVAGTAPMSVGDELVLGAKSGLILVISGGAGV